jgi:hypothetical protein
MLKSPAFFHGERQPDHSNEEERYLIIGESSQGKLIIVSYTERGNSIRLISAREVTRTEREAYEKGEAGNGR